ncbi:MAG: DUF1987 domain-containing protein [Cytophagales bacterium]|nr:DUF1987 domain-containing protein [Cytophagales bacterium]
MKLLSLEGSNITPEIKFDGDMGKLSLKGRSIPENALEFYQPIFEWLDEYLNSPQQKTIVHVQFDYFNTSSSKCILDVLKRIDRIDEAGHDVLIKWYYDENDEDMMEAGEDYSALLEAPFELLEIE